MIRRLLIVGYGSIGKRHARLARNLFPKAKIIILRHKICEEIKNKYIDHCVTSLKEAIKFEPQIAVIANPATHHIKVANHLANLGIHLLIEKPISNSSKDVLKLLNTSDTKKSVLMVGYNLRYMESLTKFRESLKKNIIGRILSVRSEVGSYLPLWRPNLDYKKSVSARKKLGGGVLLELSHDIDYLVWLFGDVKWVSSTIHKQSDLKIDTEDTAIITLGLSGVEKKNEIVAHLNMDFTRHDTTRYCKAIGQKGTLYWNALDGSLKLLKKGEHQWNTIYKKKNRQDSTYISEWKDFINCIKNNKKPLVDGKDGLKLIKIIEAIKHSSSSSSVVYLN